MEKDPVLARRELWQVRTKPRDDWYGRDDRFGSPAVVWLLRDLLPDLARTFHVGIIADAYQHSSTLFGLPPPAETVTLFRLLDRCAGRAHQWDRRGSLIRLRSRTWFFDRPREVPMRMLRRWQQLCEQRGALTLDAYGEMAVTLSDAQLAGLSAALGEAHLPQELCQAYSARHALRLYVLLNPAQRSALWNDPFLAARRMTPAQQAPLVTAWASELRYPPSPPDLSPRVDGRLTTQTTYLVRIREPGAPLNLYRDAPAPRVPETRAAETAAAGERPTAVSPTGEMKRFAITHLQLGFYCGAEPFFFCQLKVATPP
jgi:hypothetical protein